jgi:hypothetical protein
MGDKTDIGDKRKKLREKILADQEKRNGNGQPPKPEDSGSHDYKQPEERHKGIPLVLEKEYHETRKRLQATRERLRATYQKESEIRERLDATRASESATLERLKANRTYFGPPPPPPAPLTGTDSEFDPESMGKALELLMGMEDSDDDEELTELTENDVLAHANKLAEDYKTKLDRGYDKLASPATEIRRKLAQKNENWKRQYLLKHPEIKDGLSAAYKQFITNLFQSAYKMCHDDGESFIKKDAKVFEEAGKELQKFLTIEMILETKPADPEMLESVQAKGELLGYISKIPDIDFSPEQSSAISGLSTSIQQAVSYSRKEEELIDKLVHITKESGIEAALSDAHLYKAQREVWPTKEIYLAHVAEVQSLLKETLSDAVKLLLAGMDETLRKNMDPIFKSFLKSYAGVIVDMANALTKEEAAKMYGPAPKTKESV